MSPDCLERFLQRTYLSASPALVGKQLFLMGLPSGLQLLPQCHSQFLKLCGIGAMARQQARDLCLVRESRPLKRLAQRKHLASHAQFLGGGGGCHRVHGRVSGVVVSATLYCARAGRGTGPRVAAADRCRHNVWALNTPVMIMETRIPPPVLAILLAVLAWGVDQRVPQARLAFPLQAELGVILLAMGLACMLSGVIAFRRAKTTVDPLHPDRATQLVVRGIYRRTRNPMYLGMLVLLAAWVTFLGQPLAMLVMPIWVWFIGRFQIQPEEAALRRLFGASYAAYCSTVRRWI